MLGTEQFSCEMKGIFAYFEDSLQLLRVITIFMSTCVHEDHSQSLELLIVLLVVRLRLIISLKMNSA